ncbi:MAG TPA: hypothetical protein VGE16_02675, partial [Albitalea sp.]
MALPLDSTSAMPAPTNGAARFFFAVRRGFIAYARWLDSISWKRFFVLSLLALIATAIVSELPPFNLKWGEDRYEERPRPRSSGSAPATPESKSTAPIIMDGKDKSGKSYEISIDEDGVHVRRTRPAAPPPATPAPPLPPAA